MADWIKVEHTLHGKPEIDAMAEILGIDPDAVVGKLLRVWIWADQHSLDGNALGVTDSGIDRRANLPGFAVALRKVGWLEGRDAALSFPNFSRHNGQTAKQRAASNRRVTQHRERAGNANVTPLPLQKALPEEMREEIDTEGEKARTTPTVEMVIAYDAQQLPPPDAGFAAWWHDSQEASGWIGREGRPIADWKAAYRASRSARRHTEQEKKQRQKTYGGTSPRQPVDHNQAF